MTESEYPFRSMVVLVPLPVSMMVMGPVTPLYKASVGLSTTISSLPAVEEDPEALSTTVEPLKGPVILTFFKEETSK